MSCGSREAKGVAPTKKILRSRYKFFDRIASFIDMPGSSVLFALGSVGRAAEFADRGSRRAISTVMAIRKVNKPCK